jgi:asparagine N-glycosylation enzyme membrane subunit Stt3
LGLIGFCPFRAINGFAFNHRTLSYAIACAPLVHEIELIKKINNMEQRFCLDCGELLRGRADQKFCNDSCRNSYNNKKLSGSTNYMRKINRILKKNHTILETLNPEEKSTTFKGVLVKQGFNFNYYTSTYQTKNGRIYYFCYDQGYCEVESNKLILVKNDHK